MRALTSHSLEVYFNFDEMLTDKRSLCNCYKSRAIGVGRRILGLAHHFTCDAIFVRVRVGEEKDQNGDWGSGHCTICSCEGVIIVYSSY